MKKAQDSIVSSAEVQSGHFRPSFVQMPLSSEVSDARWRDEDGVVGDEDPDDDRDRLVHPFIN
jgi:hypothetical protein